MTQRKPGVSGNKGWHLKQEYSNAFSIKLP